MTGNDNPLTPAEVMELEQLLQLIAQWFHHDTAARVPTRRQRRRAPPGPLTSPPVLPPHYAAWRGAAGGRNRGAAPAPGDPADDQVDTATKWGISMSNSGELG